MKHTFPCLAMVLACASSYADDISLGQPGYGGSGCPAGSVSAVLSPDAKTLSMLFDQYTIEIGGTSGKTFDRKSCNIAIPVHVPQGRSVSVLQVDYRGFNHLPRGASSRFNVEYFFAGSQGPAFTRSFTGPLDSDYAISNLLTADSIVWSACGVDVNLRTNSSIRARTSGNAEAVSSIDSEDVKAAIIYSLQWRQCN